MQFTPVIPGKVLSMLKKDEHEKAIKVHHMNVLYDNFPDFVFFEDDEREVFVDALPNALGQSSY